MPRYIDADTLLTGADEIVGELRESCTGNEFTPPMVTNRELTAAADLIESLQAQLAEAQRREKSLTRCENCIHWDKSISFMMSAHACSYWSPSKSNPRYTAGFEFCSFAKAKPEVR